MTENREKGVEAFVRAFRTGETTAAERAEAYIAPEIVFTIGGKTYNGRDAVLDRVTGIWPVYTVYRQGYWDDPEPDGEGLKVDTSFPPYGLTLSPFTLHFSFNPQGQITRVEQEIKQDPPPPPTNKIPSDVRAVIANALVNDTPVTIGYVDEAGKPHLSSRGSTVVFSDTQLGVWVRASDGGLGAAVQKNPNIAAYYWDNKGRVLLSFEGKGHIDTDEDTRSRLYEMIAEVEQHQDPDRTGKALIIDVEVARGGTPGGRLNFKRSLS